MTDQASEPISSHPRAAGARGTARRFLALVERHYPGLYRLAYARLGDTGAAQQAVLHSLADAWSQLPRHPEQGGEAWVYELLLRQVPRQPAAALQPPVPVQEGEFWKAVAGLDDQEHLLLVLHYLLVWPAAHAARLLHVGEGAVQAQLRLFRQQFAGLLPLDQRGSPGEAIAGALQRRYLAPQMTADKAGDIARQAWRLAGQPASAPAARSTWLVVLGGLVLVVLCALAALTGWGLAASGVLDGRLLPGSNAASGSSNLPTPITPAPQLAGLTRRSSSADILQRWQDSPGLWRTVALDAQMADYGPLSYSGPPRQYRMQAWVSQPGEAFEVFGLLGSSPAQVLMTSNNQQYHRDLLQGITRQGRWDGYATSQLSQPRLRWMVYPVSSPWAERPGRFVPVQTTTFLGRGVVIYDWLNPDGQREARLWLDDQTGLILRLEEYGGPEFKTLLSTITATYAALDTPAPPAEMAGAARAFAAPGPVEDFQALQPTPTPAATLAARPTLPPDAVPAGFDPQGAQLAFALSAQAHPLDDYAEGPSNLFDLYADGYKLDSLRFGLPWGLHCVRSPNGLLLAFNNASDGAFPADEIVRWLDLRQPERVYQTESRLAGSVFAFSPHNDRLAVFSPHGYGDAPAGLFVVDVITGEVGPLIEASQAESLVWSPNGEYLAFNGRLPEDEEDALVVVHVRTGTVNYHSEEGVPPDVAFNESPVLLWGITFPVQTGGMDVCAAP